MEYGETSSNELKREVLEEIGANITDVKFSGAIENIFTYNGDLGYEIVFVYDAEFVDKSFYEKPSFFGCEDNGVPFKVYWKPISDFKNEKILLVPEELLNLL
ncbi:DNA mismatch repair protein MutT [Paraliobacillus zengyii]|uniref:DNA mismatch repair protein MutT n=1 Tax=Paraliobacillus zengyii TaxID=2213194 RepID=UPI001E597DBF|nr:DNA mismatch repair protein MutT [Paraliobacillus zengyii]